MNEWISVEDRLPEDSDRDRFGCVLVFGGNDAVLISVFDNGVFYEDTWRYRKSITHWMPLPEPPNGCK